MSFEILLDAFIQSGSQDDRSFYWDKHNKYLTVHDYKRTLTGWSVRIEYLPSYEIDRKYTNEETVEIGFEELFAFVYSKAMERTE